MEVCNRMTGSLEGCVGVAGTIVREHLEGAARTVVADASVECSSGVKLLIVQANIAFDRAAFFSQVFIQARRQWQFGVFLGYRADMDAAGV